MSIRDISLKLNLLLFLVVAPFLHSQRPQQTTPPDIRFLFLDETTGQYTVETSKGPKRVSDGPYEISSPYTPEEFGPLTVYKSFPDPEKGGYSPQKVATVNVSPGTSSILAIITPRPATDPTEAPVYEVEIIDCAPHKFPAGSIRIINRARTTLAARFGTEQVIITPGEDAVVQPIPDKRYRVASRIVSRKSTGWEAISSQTTVITPGQRITGIFIHSPTGMRHTYTDLELRELGPPPPGDFWLTFSDTVN